MKKLSIKFLNLILIITILISFVYSFFVESEVNAATSSSYTQYIKSGISAFPESYQKKLAYLKYLHPNWEFKAYYTGIDWNELTSVEGTCMTNSIHKGDLLDRNVLCWCGRRGDPGYYCPSIEAVKYYLDPRNFMGEAMIFQFLDLTEGNGITKADVEKSIKGTYLEKYADDIIAAARESGISPLHIVATIFQELGRGQNGIPKAISGTVSGYEGLYNFYNYGATDGDGAVERGLAKAKELGWTTPRIALINGAKKVLAGDYISAGQTTKYFYKFDVVGNEILRESDGKKTYSSKWFYNHQYMTNLRDPSSQSYALYCDYRDNEKLDSKLTFIIPVYNNMPKESRAPSSLYQIGGNLYYINSLGKTGPYFRETPGGKILGSLYKDTVVILLENQGTWSKVRINKTTKYNNQALTWEDTSQIGYVATEYLQKVGTDVPDYRDKVDMGNGTKPSPSPSASPTPSPSSSPNVPDVIKSDRFKIDGENIIMLPDVKVKDIKDKSANSIIKNGNVELTKSEDLIPTNAVIEISKKKYTVIKLGDVNCDGEVDVIDLALVKRHLEGITTLKGNQYNAAKLQKNSNEIDIIDMALLKRQLMKTQYITL